MTANKRAPAKKARPLLRVFQLLMAFLLASGALLTLLCFAARPAWVSGLQAQTEAVLERSAFRGAYSLGGFVPFDAPLSLSGGAFRIYGAGAAERESYAVIINMMTLYGPAAGVFIVESGGASFLGFSPLPSRIERLFDSPMLFPHVRYWEKMLPRMPLGAAQRSGR